MLIAAYALVRAVHVARSLLGRFRPQLVRAAAAMIKLFVKTVNVFMLVAALEQLFPSATQTIVAYVVALATTRPRPVN